MKKNVKSYSVKMYAEMKLDDGRVIATEDEQFMIGSKVFAIDDDGGAEPLSAGNYTMENGNKMTIGESSEILDLGEDKENPADEEAKEEEEMSAESEKTIEKDDSVTEELSAEVKDETAVLMSAEITSELITRIEELESKLVEMSREPASEGIEHSPEGSNRQESNVNLTTLSTKDRAAYYINNLK